MKILLNTATSKTAQSTDNNMSILLEQNTRPLPYGDDISNVINEYAIYQNEINACNNYRFIFTINTIASNVLYNPLSIIKNNITEEILTNNNVLTTNINNTDERINILFNGNNVYTDLDSNMASDNFINGYTIYCGLDIFDNHLFRSNSFKIARSLDDNYNDGIEHHIYTMEDIVSFPDSIENNLLENNGWLGFKNKGKIKTYDSGIFNQVKFIQDKNVCDFIDLYPSRDLFSLKPKVISSIINNNVNRSVNNNWDYYLTYPSSNDTTNFLIYDKIFGNGIPLMSFTQYIQTNATFIVCKTPYNHNLSTGDIIQITLDVNSIPTSYNFTVYNTGDLNGNDIEHFFIIKSFNDYQYTYFNTNSGIFGGRIIKLVNNIPSQYYVRVFNVISNSNLQESYKSVLSDLGFSNTIYGDQISQIVFTDDINISDLSDNRGRPLTDLYLTLRKRNESNESSGCFTSVSSGFDLLNLNDFDAIIANFPANIIANNQFAYPNYSNIHYIHNLSGNRVYSHGKNIPPEILISSLIPEDNTQPTLIFTNSPNPIESNITSGQTKFYGDIIEFIPIQDTEIMLEPIYHRFNTTQRESTLASDTILTYNDIIMDDYIYYNTNPTATSFPNEIGYVYVSNNGETCNNTSFIYRGKLIVGPRPEGYYYKPHFQIPISQWSTNIQQSIYTRWNSIDTTNHRQILYTIVNLSNNTYTFEYVKFTLLNNTPHNLSTGDTVRIIINDLSNNLILDNTFIVYVDLNDLYDFNIAKTDDIYNALYSNGIMRNDIKYTISNYDTSTPSYATDLGDGRYIWHTLKNNSDLNNVVFTNNALYITQSFNHSIKRQDPFGNYGLLYTNFPNDLIGTKLLKASTITTDKPINTQC
jgi:hypothetical protein